METLPSSSFTTETRPLSACKVRKNGLRVCIIGGGGTGAALAYDLAQRGFAVTLLEKGELTSGTTGRHHGQLHCGARYAWSDKAIARECFEESVILSRIAGSCIEYNGGFFVALSDEEKALESTFVERCIESGIPARSMDVGLVKRIEPALSEATRAAVMVPDGSFDAFRLPMMFFSAARLLGARILPWHEVVGFDIVQSRVHAVLARDLSVVPSREIKIEADFVVSAAGPWAGKVGALAGLSIPVIPAPGAMLAVKGRLVNHVISRLRPPGDGDILVPQRGLSIIGSTQRLTENPDGILPEPEEVDFLRAAGAQILPGFDSAPVHAVWAAARPLAGSRRSAAKGYHDADRPAGLPGGADTIEGRSLSRDFHVIDHEIDDGLAGFATIMGGKATVLRAMAEKTADMVCGKMNAVGECRTDRYSLPSWRFFYNGGRA